MDGLLVRVSAADASGGAVAVRLDYAQFADAYGGDWASRLRVMELPGCVLSTPSVRACQSGRVVESVNDPLTETVTAVVDLPGSQSVRSQLIEGIGSSGAPDLGGMVLALMAGPSGTSGDWSATGLSASGLWEAGGSSGDLSWSYGLRTPPAPGGLAPDLAISYSSGSVDGRTTSTNNQASWVGEGFDLGAGFIERRYVTCADDQAGGGNNTVKTGDLCWKTDNATISFGGRAGELVKDTGSGQWRLRADDGSRVERLSGGFNADNDGEYWRLTAQDGTQYFFGKGKTSAQASEPMNSAWTVPVFGNHAGEPCHATQFEDSDCAQAWRWMLDHVVDPNGNTISFYYATESNNYGRNLNQAVSSYTRGGYLARVDYGQRAGSEHSTAAPARVSFTVAERCLPSGGVTCTPAELTEQTASHWPDVPFDQICTSGSSCPDRYAPTFFTRKRLTTVTTQVWNGSGYDSVDSWTLGQEFPEPLDGTSAALWLDAITHKGHVGGTVTLPAVGFIGASFDNRVDGLDGATPLTKWRVIGITRESGGMLSWSYSDPECSPTNLPAAAESNSMRCFPVYWSIDEESEPTRHWFHKYVVTEVVESDLSGSSAHDVVTRYDYDGSGPGWHWDESPLTPDKYRTWGQYRGYGTVGTTVGETGTTQSHSEELFFRGMHGDRAGPGGGTKTVAVTDSEDVAIEDHWRLAGFTRESILFDGPGGPVVSGGIYDPWLSTVTADDGTLQAMLADVAGERTRTALAAGGFRRSEIRYEFDEHGMATLTDDLGDVSTAADDLCTRFEYAKNEPTWLLDYTSRAETVSVDCAIAPVRPADVVSDERTFYDGSAVLGAPPTKGDVTRVEQLADWGSGPIYLAMGRYTYDVHGRVVEAFDALDRETTTAYTPATGGPVTAVTVTSPDPDGAGSLTAHVTSSRLVPGWGVPDRVTDANGKVTEASFDPLGRVVGVWLPGRDKATQSASVQYEYTVRATGPNAVTTRRLNPAGDYVPGTVVFDGLLRARQAQTLAPLQFGETEPGRALTDTTYDSRGLVAEQRGPAYDDSSLPTTTVFVVADGQMPSQTRYIYDGAGRQTDAVFFEQTSELWRTTTSYGGDRVHVDPPAGGTPTTTFADVRGNTTALWEYHGDGPSGAHDVTSYGYTLAGQLESVTDAAGNTWAYTYDLLGRQTTADDPDKGLTTAVYDAAGQVTTTTDARGVTLGFTYDQLGRRTSVRDGSLAGAKRSEWVYDTLAKGQLTKSIRYVGAVAYTSEVTGFDDGYRPTGSKLTVPSVAGETQLAGTYQTSHTYHPDGSPATTVLQGKGGLLTETLVHEYEGVGLPVDLHSTAGGSYVSDAIYSPFGQPLQYAMGNTFGKTIWSTYTYQPATRRLESSQLDRQVAATYDSLVTYTYDDAGNITQVSDAPEVGAADTQCFTHDYLRRLTDAWTPSSGDCTAGPSVAGLGGPAPYWQSWTLDAVGNRLTQTTHAAAGDTTSTYSYPAAGQDRPHAVTAVATTGPGTGPDGSFGYDQAGNTTQRPYAAGDQTLAWDPEGHLQSVTDSGGGVASFLYDADGNRLLRRDLASGKTTLYWGGHTEITLTTATGVLKPLRYYSFNGQVIAVRDGKFQNNVTTLVSDHHGTASRAIANTTGTLTTRRFDPYGTPRGAVPAWKGDHGYLNGPTDLTLGLTHLGAREYDPTLGKFLSVDPLVDPLTPQTLNAYAYANNSPVTFTDPDGLALFEGSKRGGTGIVVPNSSSKSIQQAKKQQKQRLQRNLEAEHRIMNRHKNRRPLGKGTPSRPVSKPNRGGQMDFLGGVLDSAASIVDFGAQGAQLMNPAGASAYLLGFRARPGRAAYNAIDSAAGFDSTTGAYRSGNRTVNGLSWVAGLGGAARSLAGLAAKGVPALRQAYVDEVAGLTNRAASMRAAGASSEDIARALHAERRALGVKYKNLTPDDELARIYARNHEKYGDPLGPSIDYLISRGKSWDDIIDSAMRTGGKDLGY